jgi:hypothetical protein
MASAARECGLAGWRRTGRLGRFSESAGEGHGIPLNPVWQTVAIEIDDWLTGLFG